LGPTFTQYVLCHYLFHTLTPPSSRAAPSSLYDSCIYDSETRLEPLSVCALGHSPGSFAALIIVPLFTAFARLNTIRRKRVIVTMVGFLETTFQHASTSAMPPSVSISRGIEILHQFDTVMGLSPDCRGCKRIPPPAAKPQAKKNASEPINDGKKEFYEVEDDLPFIPKALWSGGVKYNAEFLPTDDGCDITVFAPGGFTSTNHWRIVRVPDVARPDSGIKRSVPDDTKRPSIVRQQTKDLDHVETESGGWYVEIISDAKCNRTFAGFVKGFLKNSHVQLQAAFIELCQQPPAQQRNRRPTIGRRKSSVF